MSASGFESVKGKTLLVVDDDEDLRETLADELRLSGANVLTAADGAEGFELSRESAIDAIISDIRMPGVDGAELLRRIKERNPAMPVLMFITGYSEMKPEDAYDPGAEAILAKPFELDDLYRCVEHILTPKLIRWTQPDPASKFATVIRRRFASIEAAEASGDIRLGRGGLFVRSLEDIPARGTGVTLEIQFESGYLADIEGIGIVLWRRGDTREGLPAGAGIEFACLTETAANQLAHAIDHLGLKAYVPRG